MRQLLLFAIVLSVFGCSRSAFKTKWVKETAPAVFNARFETSKGNFDVQVTREWSPKAADRLYQLLKHHVLDNVLFYRVVPNFVVQFGNTDTTVNKRWERFKVADEAVVKGNIKGSISFARAGKDSRSSDLFINLKDNPKLDTLNYSGVVGFPVFGNVTQGINVVEALYSGYGDKTMAVYDSLASNRAAYSAMFPKLDSIRRAFVLKSE